MIELAKHQNGIIYYKLDNPYELDKLKFGEFIYFKKYLGMSDYIGNFKSWLKRSNVLIIVAVSQNKVVGWVMNEKWSEPSIDGKPVVVLRAVEVSPEITKSGIGRGLFNLTSMAVYGHIITKPVNEIAKSFFQSMKFISPSQSSPINLSNHPGYMVLKYDINRKLGVADGLTIHEDAVFNCKSLLFPSDMVEIIKEEAARKKLAEKSDSGVENAVLQDSKTTKAKKTTMETKAAPSTSISQSDKSSVQKNVSHSSTKTNNNKPQTLDDSAIGTFMAMQKMMTPCTCGEFKAKKYQVSNDREGIAIVCAVCGRERYFLPQKRV